MDTQLRLRFGAGHIADEASLAERLRTGAQHKKKTPAGFPSGFLPPIWWARALVPAAEYPSA